MNNFSITIHIDVFLHAMYVQCMYNISKNNIYLPYEQYNCRCVMEIRGKFTN